MRKTENSLANITKLLSGSGIEINRDRPAIEIKDFTKKFRRFTSLKDVNFNVNHGVIHGFIGPNGSGKTTTIKSLIGAYIPTKGELYINGYKAGTANANKSIGYIPERASFPKHLNAIEYLVSMAKLSGIKGKVARENAKKILNFLKLSDQAKRKPISFSSGMQKKILLAQALLTDPSILILDEPAANLDPSSRNELFQQLIVLRNSGKTILISSHVLAELEKIVDEVTFLYYGNMLYTGTTDDFIGSGSSLFIKATDNDKLAKFLKKKKIPYHGDIKTELRIDNISTKKSDTLFKNLGKEDISIISFRANDLQSAYEMMALKANKKDKGVQELKPAIMEKITEKGKEIISGMNHSKGASDKGGDK